jgi:HlyD family secretion protein
MSDVETASNLHPTDLAAGAQRFDRGDIAEGVKTYLIGLALATLLTLVSFFIAGTTLVWTPSIPVALIVLAIAQIGVHLVFFLHITTGPESVNNVLALAFGVLIVLLVIAGSLWIMTTLNHNMVMTSERMRLSGLEARAIATKGVVGATTTAPIGARISGVIQSLDCQTGTQVAAGQICAKIDPRPYQTIVDQTSAKLGALEAQLEKDKSTLASEKKHVERLETLAKRRKVSRKGLAKARSSLEQAQAEVTRGEAEITELEAALRSAETDLGQTDVVSPLAGTIVSRDVELGETVTATSPPLFVIATDLSVIRIDATIDAKESYDIRPGTRVMFTVETIPNQTFTGMVTKIQSPPQTDEHALTTDVVIEAPNADLVLKPGMEAMVRILPE